MCVYAADVFQQECLCAWRAHSGEVFNVQFSSDETSVYSMGSDSAFCQWSIIQSGAKVQNYVCVLQPLERDNSYVVYESLLHECKTYMIWPSFRPLSVCSSGLV